MRKYVYLMVLMCFMLAACQTTPPMPPEIKYIAVTPDDSLLQDCAIEPPPAKSVYLANYGTRIGTSEVDMVLNELANLREREGLLIRLNTKQVSNLQSCNVKLQKLREWKQKIKTEVNTPQKKE